MLGIYLLHPAGTAQNKMAVFKFIRDSGRENGTGYFDTGRYAISGKENTADLTTFQKLSNLSGD